MRVAPFPFRILHITKRATTRSPNSKSSTSWVTADADRAQSLVGSTLDQWYGLSN